MKKTMITILTGSILLLCVGISYSYFTGMITGEGKKLKVAATELRILFTDSSSLSNNEIEPGWKESKTFSVKNESDDSFNYNILFENLVNTFVTEGFLQYKITSSNGYNMEGYLDIPKSNTPTDIVLAYDIDIPMDVTHEYTIEFVYHNSETVDQSEDMGKIFEGNLAIIEGSANPDIKYTVTMNSDNGTINPTSNQAIKYENLEFEVTLNTGFDINSMSVSCDPVANTVIVDNKIKVNDIRQDHNCEVSFDKELYTVNIVVNNGKSDALNKVVEYGGFGTATITPNYGYTLENATVEGIGCSITGDILTISNVQSNGTCTVTLPRDKYNVILTGTGIASSNSPQEAEYKGSTTINFTLSEGYELGDNVINCDNGTPNITGNVLTVSNVTADTTCTLSPVLKSYDVTLVVNGGTPENETKSVTHNGSTTYTISNSTGYKLELNGNITCTGNAVGSLNGSTVTISGVTAMQTCTVNLKKQTYSVSVGVNDSAMGSVSPANSTVNHGDNLTITISPNTGYKYSSNDCGLTPSNNQMTFTNITEVKSCKVTFVANTYTVTANVTNGKIGSTTSSSKSVAYNSSTSWTITANSGFTTSGATVTGGCTLDETTGILTASNVTSTMSCNVELKLDYSKLKTLADTIKAVYSPQSGRTDFSVTDSGTPKLYTGSDDQGTTYYFSGDGSSMNNWVSFAGNMWRIIRINGNGSVRLLYAGDGNAGSSSNNYNGVGSSSGKSAYNSSNSHPQYVGWKYTSGNSLSANRGNGTESTIYNSVNSWYTGLNATDKNYIDTNAIYCNDRSITSGSYSTSNTFYYASGTRLRESSPIPVFTCSSTSDRFKGAKGDIPVGLMTADEIVYAGGKLYSINSKAYYNLAKDGKSSITETFWWTMTPYSWNDIGGWAYVFISGKRGDLNDSSSDMEYIVRPVVSLKSNVLVTGGNGSGTNPYTLTYNGTV